MISNRSYTPHAVTENQYLSMLKNTGMTRGVLVQISVYGTDNRFMQNVLSKHPEHLRGIAVVDPNISEHELEKMHEFGVRGIRINFLFKGGIGFNAVERLAHKIKHLGWHLQFLMDANSIAMLMPKLSSLPVIGVIDHMGHTAVSAGIGSLAMQNMIHLMQEKGWWVKLPGAYGISHQFPDFNDVSDWAKTLLHAASDQCVWGSDWTHVAIKQMPNTGDLMNQLPLWLDNQEDIRKVLVTNPQHLYDFAHQY
ncbi:amidohydrolase family protein [Avibacterium paragallinarum]